MNARIGDSMTSVLGTAFALGLLLLATDLSAQQPATLLGVPCTGSADQQVMETGTGRTYILDYPCNLQAGEEVTLILNLHGGGSSGSWQRRYFPIYDQKEALRLVVASPFSPTRRWSEDDDQYLQNIVTTLVGEIGSANVRAFWLAGHSQGGATSRRIVCSSFFASKVDGFLSLSGGRLGGAAPRAPNAGRPVQADAPPAAAPTPGAAPGAAAAPAAGEPECDFSHIYTTGEHEIMSLPTTSSLAARFGCGARVGPESVVDSEAGYVHDGGNQNPGSKEWGLLPRPGTAEVFVYPGCSSGRVVADVVRIDKGHTEGLEPRVTRELGQLMTSAAGGKIRRGG